MVKCWAMAAGGDLFTEAISTKVWGRRGQGLPHVHEQDSPQAPDDGIGPLERVEKLGPGLTPHSMMEMVEKRKTLGGEEGDGQRDKEELVLLLGTGPPGGGENACGLLGAGLAASVQTLQNPLPYVELR
ncbi:hypothetical protein ColLi_07439 [Colletotrichum liriopes]|uniref:Uncharacterized protein n=1 Tax=Colletotrichum liriopes TaxID=708192 RepID=A0AA37GP29_9PEZI|nr:hypothetical protein ColLi_07439 [Colletotrichum liriopes]